MYRKLLGSSLAGFGLVISFANGQDISLVSLEQSLNFYAESSEFGVFSYDEGPFDLPFSYTGGRAGYSAALFGNGLRVEAGVGHRIDGGGSTYHEIITSTLLLKFDLSANASAQVQTFRRGGDAESYGEAFAYGAVRGALYRQASSGLVLVERLNYSGTSWTGRTKFLFAGSYILRSDLIAEAYVGIGGGEAGGYIVQQTDITVNSVPEPAVLSSFAILGLGVILRRSRKH